MSKPGYRTTEFWFTLVSFIFSGLFLTGVIGDYDQKEQLINIVTHGVESVILIGGQLFLLRKYMDDRKQKKLVEERRKQLELENQKKELEDYIGVGKKHDKVNINTATLGELVQLPHIGTVLAQKIIDYRHNQLFTDPKELLIIDGIGENTYKDIEKYVTVKE